VTDFDRSLPRILVYEGGKVDDPQDPGGRTAYGITQAVYTAYRASKGLPSEDVFDIDQPTVADIYKTRYWNAVRGDDLPPGLNFAVFDAAVNSGVGRAIEWLQAALGVGVDGIIGDKTLQAIAAVGPVDVVIEDLCSRRLGSLKRLKTWGRYGKGWSARIANVQKTALAWNNATPLPVSVKALGGHKKAVVNDQTIAAPPMGQMTAHITTAAGSAATVATQAAQQFQPLQDTFAWLKYVCAGLTLLAVVIGIIVKIMSDANDAAQKSQATAMVDPDADASCFAVNLPVGNP